MGTEWDPALEVGHAEIDGQHREIFRRYAALVDAMSSGAAADLGALFEFLGAYAVEHFTAEERVMEEIGYPGATVHAAAHARFVREYGELVALWQANGTSQGVVVKARTWIGDWLRAHIAGVDLALARYVKGRRARADTPAPA